MLIDNSVNLSSHTLDGAPAAAHAIFCQLLLAARAHVFAQGPMSDTDAQRLNDLGFAVEDALAARACA